MTDAILFDMDGVVLEGRGTDPAVYADAADAAIEKLALEPTDGQRRTFRSDGHSADLDDACDALGVDPERFWARREQEASRIANDRIRSGERTTYDDIAAVRDLADRTTLGLVSNNRQETVEFVADHFDLGNAFATVRGREPTIAGYHRRKPAPDYLEAALETIGTTEAIYVGDRSTDVEAAGAAGIDAAFLRRPHNRDEPLPSGATVELGSLDDFEAVLAPRDGYPDSNRINSSALRASSVARSPNESE